MGRLMVREQCISRTETSCKQMVGVKDEHMVMETVTLEMVRCTAECSKTDIVTVEERRCGTTANVTRGFWKNSGLAGYGFRQFVNASGKMSFCFGKFVNVNLPLFHLHTIVTKHISLIGRRANMTMYAQSQTLKSSKHFNNVSTIAQN